MKRAQWLALGAGISCGAVVVSSLAASCAVPGFDLVDSTPGGQGGESAGGRGGSGASGGQGACQSVEPPLSPATTDPGADVDFVAAVRTLDFGEDFTPGVGPTVGYNLDARCTCLGDAPSCAPVGNEPEECDGPGGRDNAVARLFDNLSMFEPNAFNSQSHSASANDGSFSLLFRVTDYNGAANDESVTLAIYTSGGMNRDPCNPTTPSWDGTDRWPVDAISLGTGAGGGAGGAGGLGGSGGAGGACAGAQGYDLDDPRFISAFGYVTEGVLVANLPEAGIALSVDDAPILLRLVGGSVTARIEASAEGYYLRSGVMTGRWKVTDFFGFVGTFTTGGNHICKDSVLYGPIKELVCNYADIHAEVLGSAAPCDAMSFGMGFEASPAQLGIVVEDNTSGQGGGCPVDQDPAGDDCSGME